MSTYETIALRRTDLGWVATDVEREISSAPMDSREEALDDLDENIALEDGDLQLSEEARRDADEAGEEGTVSHEELKAEFGL